MVRRATGVNYTRFFQINGHRIDDQHRSFTLYGWQRKDKLRKHIEADHLERVSSTRLTVQTLD